jgi:hypothetical protein
MANRVLRDWTTSESIESISFGAEVFFTRLIMKADDFGTYYANPKLLKAALFPLKEVSYDEIRAWIIECVKAGLVFLYSIEEKEYIRIKNFGQRLRNMRNAFPHPKPQNLPEVKDEPPEDTLPQGSSTRSIPPQVAASVSHTPPDIETETETETETEVERETARVVAGKKEVPRGTTQLTKLEIFERLFSDEIYVEELASVHRNKDLKRAFEECYIHHSNAPNPPSEIHEWKQKLNTWLINTKNGSSKKADAINIRRENFAKRNS